MEFDCQGNDYDCEGAKINMSDKNKRLCPDDGSVCFMKEEDKHGKGCWLCPKIQNMRETPYDKLKDGVENGSN